MNEQNVPQLYLISLKYKNSNAVRLIAVDYGLSHPVAPTHLRYVEPYEESSKEVVFKDLKSATIIEYPVAKADTPLLHYEDGKLHYLSLCDISVRNGYPKNCMYGHFPN